LGSPGQELRGGAVGYWNRRRRLRDRMAGELGRKVFIKILVRNDVESRRKVACKMRLMRGGRL